MAAIPPGSEAPVCAGPRIAILCHGGGGGSTRVAVDLAAALDRRGRDVLLVTLGRPRRPPPAGLRHVVIPGGRPPARRLGSPWGDAEVAAIGASVTAICRREKIGLLHFHYGMPFAAVAAALGRDGGSGRPAIVATLHGSDITTAAGDPATARALAGALGHADAVSTVSAAYAGMLRGAVDVASPTVVPNFVPDAGSARPARRRRAGAPPVLIHVSTFRPIKDTRAVARVFLAVRRRLRCRLDLAGDGPDWLGLRALLGRRTGDVRFLGFRNDVPALLHAADLLLLTSRAESFSLVALEAMAAGVPVVAPRVGGLPEVVGDAGLLFHPGRSADAAARIVALLHAPIRRRRLAAVARRRAAGFGEADAVARYEALYQAALARRPAPVAVNP